jgi:hypothetical protein
LAALAEAAAPLTGLNDDIQFSEEEKKTMTREDMHIEKTKPLPPTPLRDGAEASVEPPPVQSAPAPQPEQDEPYEPLFVHSDNESFRERWHRVQAGFVDDPKTAVREADQLVGDVIHRLTDSFTGAREKIEQGWSQGGEVSTEDLRQALRRYRSFFERLLTM